MKQKDTSVKILPSRSNLAFPPREEGVSFSPDNGWKESGGCTRKRVPAESGGHTRSSLRSVFIRELIHATTKTRSNVFGGGIPKKRISSSWDRWWELEVKRRVPNDRPIVRLILAEEDGPGLRWCGAARLTHPPRESEGDSCRVKAGETRYPPADGRQEGHQKLARQNCRAKIPPVSAVHRRRFLLLWNEIRNSDSMAAKKKFFLRENRSSSTGMRDRRRERRFTYWWPSEGGEKERSSMFWKKERERERYFRIGAVKYPWGRLRRFKRARLLVGHRKLARTSDETRFVSFLHLPSSSFASNFVPVAVVVWSRAQRSPEYRQPDRGDARGAATSNLAFTPEFLSNVRNIGVSARNTERFSPPSRAFDVKLLSFYPRYNSLSLDLPFFFNRICQFVVKSWAKRDDWKELDRYTIIIEAILRRRVSTYLFNFSKLITNSNELIIRIDFILIFAHLRSREPSCMQAWRCSVRKCNCRHARVSFCRPSGSIRSWSARLSRLAPRRSWSCAPGDTRTRRGAIPPRPSVDTPVEGSSLASRVNRGRLVWSSTLPWSSSARNSVAPDAT